MSIPENFKKLAGEWRGSNILHTSWIVENPVDESETSCFVELKAGEKFLKIEYDWIYENKKQDGLMLIGCENDSDEIRAFWIDSWHLSDKFMISEGKYTEDSVSLKGFYKVPNHPDWGWRTDIIFSDEDFFKFVMYNVSPEGEEMLAVESAYTRK